MFPLYHKAASSQAASAVVLVVDVAFHLDDLDGMSTPGIGGVQSLPQVCVDMLPPRGLRWALAEAVHHPRTVREEMIIAAGFVIYILHVHHGSL